MLLLLLLEIIKNGQPKQSIIMVIGNQMALISSAMENRCFVNQYTWDYFNHSSLRSSNLYIVDSTVQYPRTSYVNDHHLLNLCYGNNAKISLAQSIINQSLALIQGRIVLVVIIYCGCNCIGVCNQSRQFKFASERQY